MKKQKHIEILPSKEELALDRLAGAVLQRLATKQAEAEANKPETDEELSESVLLQPWMLPRHVANAIRNLLPATHYSAWDGVYETYGCFRCERKDVPHQSLSLCAGCYGMLMSRKKAQIVKNVEGQNGRPTVAQMKAQITQNEDTAKKILADMGVIPKRLPAATKRLG